MTSYNTDGTVGPWAREKLDCLRAWLDPYTTILKEQSKWCEAYYYVDAFAGAGRAPLRRTTTSDPTQFLLDIPNFRNEQGEQLEYVEGSPIVALGLSNPFSHYIFVEKNSARAENLLELAGSKSLLERVEIHSEDANKVIQDRLINSHIDWRRNRGVIFLDPFGLQVPWRTLELIASTAALEVMINFPVGMAIQRLLPQHGVSNEAHRNMLTEYFGVNDWEDIVYERPNDLFSDNLVRKYDDAGTRLVRWYSRRLRSAFGYVSTPRLFKNSQGGHLYYLIHAGPNKTGSKIANYVLANGQIV